jgi:hypothetical protein
MRESDLLRYSCLRSEHHCRRNQTDTSNHPVHTALLLPSNCIARTFAVARVPSCPSHSLQTCWRRLPIHCC